MKEVNPYDDEIDCEECEKERLKDVHEIKCLCRCHWTREDWQKEKYEYMRDINQ